MAAPSYTEDLTDIATGDEAAGWAEFTGGGFADQGSPVYQDADYPYIQGSYAVTQSCSKTKTLGSLGYDSGGSISLPTDGAFLVWQIFSSPFAIDDYVGTTTTYAGMMVLVGQDLANFRVWDIGGKDKSPNPYGGWQCHAVNTTISQDLEVGTYTGDQVVGAAVALTAYPSKGNPHAVDVMRFGRCSSIFEEGTGGVPCTFQGFAAQNDLQTNRWGLIQETPGGYLWQGRMLIGTDSTESYFVDSNTSIFIKWTPKVTYNFNTIEIQNIDTYISWSGITFQVLDISTASPGRLLMSAPADVYFDQCTFIDMGEFIFDSTTDVNTVNITDTTFRRCGEIIQGGAVFDGCSFLNSDSTTTVQVDNLNNIDNCVFESDGSNHAMELDSNHAGSAFTLVGCTYESYAVSDGNTGNEVIYNNSGGAVTINISGGDIPTIRNGSGSTTTVVASIVWTFEIRNSNNDFVTGVEFRIYNSGTQTQVYGVENSATGTEVYTFDQSLAGNNVDVVVMDVPDYLYFRQTLVRPSGNQTSTLVLADDRWYENPDVTKTRSWGLRPTDDYKTAVDTYIDLNNSTTKYNTSESLILGIVQYILFDPQMESYQIPSNATITSAKLWIYIYNITGSGNFWLTARYVRRDWIPSQTDYLEYATSTAWASSGCQTTADRSDTADDDHNITGVTGWLSFDVSSTVQDWADGTITDFNGGWIIEDIDVNIVSDVRSSDYTGDTSLRPYLEVTWTQ